MTSKISNGVRGSEEELPTKKSKTTGDSPLEKLPQELFELIGRFLPHEDKIKLSRASRVTYTTTMDVTDRDIRSLVERVAKKVLDIVSESRVSVGEDSESYLITKIKKYLDNITKHRFEKPQTPADAEKLKLILEVQSLNEIVKELDLEELDSLISYLEKPSGKCHSDFIRLVRDLRNIRSDIRELLNEARHAHTDEDKAMKLLGYIIPNETEVGFSNIEFSTARDFNEWIDIVQTLSQDRFLVCVVALFKNCQLPRQTIDKVLARISDASTGVELRGVLTNFLAFTQAQNMSKDQYLKLLEICPQDLKWRWILAWHDAEGVEREISEEDASLIRGSLRGEDLITKCDFYEQFVELDISEAESLRLINDIWAMDELLAKKVGLLNTLATRQVSDAVISRIVELLEAKFRENPNDFFKGIFNGERVFLRISHQEILNRLLPVVLDFIETDEEIPTEGTGGDLAVKLNRIQAILDAKGAIPQAILERVLNIVFSIDQENLFRKNLLIKVRDDETNEVYDLVSDDTHIRAYSAVIGKLMKKDLSEDRLGQCLRAFELTFKRYKKPADHKKYAEAVSAAFEKADMPEKREECLSFMEELHRSGQFDSRTEIKVLKGMVRNPSFEGSDLESLLVRFDTQLNLMQKLELFEQYALSRDEISVESAEKLLDALQAIVFIDGRVPTMFRFEAIAKFYKSLIQKMDSDELISRILDQMEKLSSRKESDIVVLHKVLEFVFEKDLSPKLFNKALDLMGYRCVNPSQEESKSRSRVYDAMYKTAGIDSLV